MPLVMIEGPEISLNKKRELVAKIAEVISSVYGLPKQIITVVIHENPPENVGPGGELLIDRKRG